MNPVLIWEFQYGSQHCGQEMVFLDIWTQEAALVARRGEEGLFQSGSAPRAPHPLLNEGLGFPSPPRAECLAVQPLLRPAFRNLVAQGIMGLWLPGLSGNPVDSAHPG